MFRTMAAAALIALAATAASAQTGGGPVQILTTVPAEAATVTHWYKQSVYDPSDSKIGEIEDVLLDKQGKVHSLIVGVGGFLGIGEKHVAVPFNAVQFKTKDKNNWYAVMNSTKDALKNAPGFKYDRTNMVWAPDNAPASGTTGTQPRPTPR
jgi:sporulation protein YlmC with PRC-barrel domain